MKGKWQISGDRHNVDEEGKRCFKVYRSIDTRSADREYLWNSFPTEKEAQEYADKLNKARDEEILNSASARIELRGRRHHG